MPTKHAIKSITNIGGLVTGLAYLSQLFSINIGSDEISTAVKSVVALVGVLMVWYGRYRKGDLHLGMGK